MNCAPESLYQYVSTVTCRHEKVKNNHNAGFNDIVKTVTKQEDPKIMFEEITHTWTYIYTL